MTEELITEFHHRRAIEEQALADLAPDVVQVIAHDQLSQLHVRALGRDTVHLPQETALEVTAVAGDVVVSGAMGAVTHLTPNAAVVTSDRLLARARDAGRQVPTPSSAQPGSALTDDAGRTTDDRKANIQLISNTSDSAAERAS